MNLTGRPNQIHKFSELSNEIRGQIPNISIRAISSDFSRQFKRRRITIIILVM